jgi:phytanoyl-CoA hydroxylase
MNPKYRVFTYTGTITQEHRKFFDEYGFLHFRSFLAHNGVDSCLQEVNKIEQHLLANKVEEINGTSLKFGLNEENQTFIQQINFVSQFSKRLQGFLRTPFFQEMKMLLSSSGARIGENELNGLVFKHYLNTNGSSVKDLDWSSGSEKMLSVGIFLDDCPSTKGGLRILPSTHKQGKITHYLYKLPLLTSHSNEISLDIQAGDLTILHGNIWHRFVGSAQKGEASRQRYLYFPILTGKYEPKQEYKPLQISNAMGNLLL